MWELQPLSTNRRTTEISLLIGENTSLTLSQIPHNFCGITFPLSLFSSSLVMCKISLDALPIYRQASKQRTKGHQLMLQVAPNWCPFCWLSCTNLVPANFTRNKTKIQNYLTIKNLILRNINLFFILCVIMIYIDYRYKS
jgi:hypothetical protein